MEKSITKGQNFDSFAEFDKVFKTYCDKTHQVYIKRSCRQLKIEDIRTGTAEDRELLKNKIVYKDIVYDCVHKGECRNNPHKKGERVNVLSKKILNFGCLFYLFCSTIQAFKTTYYFVLEIFF